jgi:hypothetical protein
MFNYYYFLFLFLYAESLQYATMDVCFRVNQQLQANIMSALLHYFDIALLSPRTKDMPPEDINLGIYSS